MDVGVGLFDVSHLNQNLSYFHVGAQRIAFGAGYVGAGQLALVYFEPSLRIARRRIFLAEKLKETAHHIWADNALANFDGLFAINHSLVEATKLGTRSGALEIEMREIRAGLRTGAGIGPGLEPIDLFEIGFFIVENGSDVGNAAWWR